MSHTDLAILLLLALVGLYRPVGAGSSYAALLQPFDDGQRRRLAVGLFLGVAGVAVVTLLVVEPLLELLGLPAAALSATGGITLMIAALPLMLGRAAEPDRQVSAPSGKSWRQVVVMPLTFPLTIGGAAIAVLIGFRAESHGPVGVLALIAAALLYAAVTGVCVLVAGRAGRGPADRARAVQDRVAGMLLTAIAATLLASGFTRLVASVLHGLGQHGH
ncbi:MarC family protein [Dactylosporangium sp. NPDC000555]|uniref:MarC family protein n=1 Tax=Dactylosporangium sp. NPDC000555 TaxID=3154260 RepID=UPI0033282E81